MNNIMHSLTSLTNLKLIIMEQKLRMVKKQQIFMEAYCVYGQF